MALKRFSEFIAETSFAGSGFIAGIGVDASFSNKDVVSADFPSEDGVDDKQGSSSNDGVSFSDADNFGEDADTQNDILYVSHYPHQVISGMDVIRLKSTDFDRIHENEDIIKMRKSKKDSVVLHFTDLHQYYIMDLLTLNHLTRFHPKAEDLHNVKS